MQIEVTVTEGFLAPINRNVNERVGHAFQHIWWRGIRGKKWECGGLGTEGKRQQDPSGNRSSIYTDVCQHQEIVDDTYWEEGAGNITTFLLKEAMHWLGTAQGFPL